MLYEDGMLVEELVPLLVKRLGQVPSGCTASQWAATAPPLLVVLGCPAGETGSSRAHRAFMLQAREAMII